MHEEVKCDQDNEGNDYGSAAEDGKEAIFTLRKGKDREPFRYRRSRRKGLQSQKGDQLEWANTIPKAACK